MKHIILLFLFINPLFPHEKISTYKVEGMMCSISCPKSIQESLDGIKGIKSCKVEFDTKTAIIVYDNDKIDSEKIASTIEKNTYFKVKNKIKKEKWSLFNWLFKRN